MTSGPKTPDDPLQRAIDFAIAHERWLGADHADALFGLIGEALDAVAA